MAEESKEKKGVQPGGRRTEHLVDPDKNKKAWHKGHRCFRTRLNEASPPTSKDGEV